MSDPDDNVASTTSTPRARPLTSRLRRGKFCFSGGVPTANSEITRPRAARSCASARLRAGYTRSGPVPTTAMLLPAPASPPRCAAVSMPSARPLTMARPAADNAAAKASASAHP